MWRTCFAPCFPSTTTRMTVRSGSPSSNCHTLKRSASVTSRGRTVPEAAWISFVEKKPASRRIRIRTAWPGYRMVFSTMFGVSQVRSRERSPSVLKASSEPRPGKSTSSTSESAGIVTSTPPLRMRAGRMYSSMTSPGEVGALYSHGHLRSTGSPPTRQWNDIVSSSCASKRPSTRLLSPGAIPQSTRQHTPASAASRSSPKASSGKNEMSTTGRPS